MIKLMRNKTRPARFFRTALAAAFFAFIAVVFGAYTRLSEAGLGCPEGPACVGRAIAPGAAQDAINKRPTSPRAWKDMAARYVAGGLGILLLRLFVLGWQLRRRPGQQVLIPSITFLLVFGLTAMSVFTIDLQYKPLVMMTQFLGSLLVLALLWWIVLRQQRIFPSVASTPLTRSLRPRAFAALLLVLLAIALGGWSMVNYAAAACPDFPTCQGDYWANADLEAGLFGWQADGLAYDRSELTLSAAAAIQFAHRIGGFLVVLYLGWLSLHLLRVGIQENLCRYGLLLLVMISFATALGIMAAVGGLELPTGVGHSVVAAMLLLSTVTLYHVLRAPRSS